MAVGRDRPDEMSDELPARVRERVEIEEWTERASLENRAANPFSDPEPEPEAETPQAAFMRRMAEQREAEDKHEARVNRAHARGPRRAARLAADPLRTLFERQQVARRLVRSRSTR